MLSSGKARLESDRRRRGGLGALFRPIAALVIVAASLAAGLACDRNIEPFDPDVKPARPDLSRIFPEPPDNQPPGQDAAAMPAMPGASRGTASGGEIRGRVEVDPDLASGVAPGATLFIIARRAGVAGGPPLAVLRVPSPQFPFEFEIGPENVMVPSMRFEGDITLGARLDSDGNATTRTPGDLQGQLAGSVNPGAQDVEIRLDKRL